MLRGHQQAVHSCAFLGSGGHAVSGGNDRTLRLWDCSGSGGESADPAACLGEHHFGSAVQSIAVLSAAPADNGSTDGTVELTFDDSLVPATPTAPIRLAIGCFDGSIHVAQVDADMRGLSILHSTGGEAAADDGGGGGFAAAGEGDVGGNSGGGGGGQGEGFSAF